MERARQKQGDIAPGFSTQTRVPHFWPTDFTRGARFVWNAIGGASPAAGAAVLTWTPSRLDVVSQPAVGHRTHTMA